MKMFHCNKTPSSQSKCLLLLYLHCHTIHSNCTNTYSTVQYCPRQIGAVPNAVHTEWPLLEQLHGHAGKPLTLKVPKHVLLSVQIGIARC